MKILVVDKLSAKAVRELERLGAQVETRDLKAADLPAALGETEVLVVRSTKVTAAAIEAGRNLGLVVRAGAGVDNIDVAAASKRGIYVANCPGKNADAVAELALGLLLAADRGIADATAALREGKWLKQKFGKASGLKGRTLGIVGLGTIGKAVAKRALGLEMRVAAWSRSLTPEAAEALGVTYAATPLELAALADAVTVHVAAGPETKGLIGREFLAALKPGAILVNAARGEVLDQEALLEAIRDKGIKAALDVFADEPSGGEAVFAQTDTARALSACTPHVGASTEQAAEAIAAETVRVVKSFKETGIPVNAVNLCARSPAAYALVVRHYNRVGVLAGVLGLLRGEGINVEEMQNTVFAGAGASCCSLLLDSAPSTAALESLAADPNIIQARLAPRE